MPEKSFCIHGHFYQPPRVDPRTKAIPQEPGAQPFSNWTERIYHECYFPNAQKENYKRISFNFGPTLTAWLEENHNETLTEIIRQENSVFNTYGVSNAMAQPYFHAILPLLPHRERETLVRWGIDEFSTRYGHPPKGMWLPETAVDLDSLEVLADNNIQFTILAPWQAKDSELDITQPYRILLPNDKEMIVFFYNSFLSSEISFNTSATMQADTFASNWLKPQYEALQRDQDQLLLAASDGELYGHHMAEREKFLEYLLDQAIQKDSFKVTFPALWLQSHPQIDITEINENTSWSCHHGIERWRDVCGDAPNATWKAPLRRFLDQLGKSLDTMYLEFTQEYIQDPWKLRDAYIDLILGKCTGKELVQGYAIKKLGDDVLKQVLMMLDSQFERLRMHSSDAWFFFDFDSIEPLNGLKYAAHAVWLARSVTGKDVSAPLLSDLALASSDETGLSGDAAFLKILNSYSLSDK
jgi:alpha-amylase/alpha-mannosidase (GH57 family)